MGERQLPIVGETATIATCIEDEPILSSAFELPADYQVDDAGKRMLVSISHDCPVFMWNLS